MVGTTIGKYRIVEKLGRGGMGTVYKAVDETLDREVAVKVLNSDVDDSTLMARFRAEAKTVARLNHPQIATIYEIYRSDTDLLMVMELVRGETLDRLSSRVGPLAPEQAAALMVQVLGALAHAHRAGIVHRDLKPANLMVTDTGTVKVMDFGIARVLGAEHLTMDGMLMGTPAYMAPEQVMGQDVDARTDLYSAGVVFYRLLTGCLPFQADTPIAIVRKQMSDPPTPARTYRPDLPDWSETILTRALEKDPKDRFQSAEEFRSALVSAVGSSNLPTGVLGTDFHLPAPLVPPTVSVRATPSPAPAQGQTPVELTALELAPTLIGEATPVQMRRAEQPEPPEAEAPDDDVTVFASPASAAMAAAEMATVEMTAPAPVVPSPPLQQPPPPTATTTARPGSRKGMGIYGGVAAIVALVAAVVAFTLLRNPGPPSETPPSASESVTPPAADTSVAAVTTPEETPAVAPAAASTSAAPAASVTPPGGNATASGVQRPAPARRPAAAPTAARPSEAPIAPLESSPIASPVAPVTPPPPALVVLPPLQFSAQTVVVEGGRNRQRDTTVQLADGTVTVTDKDKKVVTTVPVAAVVGFTYSNSKQPLWNSPQGPAEITHLDGGAFGFLRGDQHWIALRTDAMSLVLRVRDQDSRRILAGLEERLGRKVERVEEP